MYNGESFQIHENMSEPTGAVKIIIKITHFRFLLINFGLILYDEELNTKTPIIYYIKLTFGLTYSLAIYGIDAWQQ